MTDLTIPPKTAVSIKDDAHPTAIWALQKALGITTDGRYGEETKAAVCSYQNPRGLKADGVAGPLTQARLARTVIAQADLIKELPHGLMRSICEGESGNYIAAVNWGSPGGVDVGYVQRRIYDPPSQTAIKRAFDSLHQFKLLRTRLLNLSATYRSRPAVHSNERAMRLAVLSWNYPYAADLFSRTKEADLSSYWTTPQKWVIAIGAHFTDGHPVQDPLGWTKYYALGDPRHNHPGTMVKYVQTWG